MNAKISESLGLMTMSEAKQMEIILPDSHEVSSIKVDDEDRQAAEDRKYARENMKEVIEHGTSALNDILDIARATEDPRAFEVFSNIMKSVIDANKSLVSINNNSARKGKPSKDSEDNNNNNTAVTNNNLYVGSTKDLADLINKEKK